MENLRVLEGSEVFFRGLQHPYHRFKSGSRLLRISALQKSFFVMGFILLRVLEFFVFRKMEMPETKNHLLCGWRQSVVQKNHLSVTIELFRHYCKKGKVILWRIRIMI